MNQIVKYIIGFIAFLCCCDSTNAQQRRIDLENKFLSPHDSSFYKLPQRLPIKFRCKNLGPDTIFPGDSIRYRTCLYHCGDLHFYRINHAIAPGDSMVYFDTLDFDVSSLTVNYVTLEWQFAPLVYNNVGGPKDEIIESWESTRFDNNKDTVTIFFRRETSNTRKWNQDIKSYFYPNPVCEGTLFFKDWGKTVRSISLYDYLGKLIDIKSIEKGMQSVDVSLLEKGYYCVRIKLQDGSIINEKIIVQ